MRLSTLRGLQFIAVISTIISITQGQSQEKIVALNKAEPINVDVVDNNHVSHEEIADGYNLASVDERQGVLSDIKPLLHTLQSTWYQLWLGTWPTSIDWTGAVINNQLVATLDVFSAARLTDDGQITQHLSDNEISLYFAHITAYYFGEDAPALRGEAYDDMLWVVLSWLDSVKFVQGHSQRHHAGEWYGKQYVEVFAHRARVFYNITTGGWGDDLCNGGMTWNPDFEPYKNSVTNQLFIAASVSMYLSFPGDDNDAPFVVRSRYKQHDKRFLDAATRGYSWLQASNMTNFQGLYVDGYHISNLQKNGTNGTHNTRCDDRNEMVYTYNQGVILSALHDLYTATGNVSYLNDGHALVRNTITATGWNLSSSRPVNSSAWQGLGRNGIMEEFCDSTGLCDQNAHTFKSIYFHHLAAFCAGEGKHSSASPDLPRLDAGTLARHRRRCFRYTPWTRHNAKAAMSTKDSRGRIGTWWGAKHATDSDDIRLADLVKLPVGAVDYRNSQLALRRFHKSGRSHAQQAVTWKHKSAKRHAARAQQLMSGLTGRPDGDLNDRGRGRTVESHIGGLAVLRCLWQLEQLSDDS